MTQATHATPTNGDGPVFDIDALVNEALIMPATTTLTAADVAGLLPGLARFGGAARRPALEALRALVAPLPTDERAGLEVALLDNLFDNKAELDGFLESCPPPPGVHRFRLETLAELFARPDKDWIIEQIIGAGDIGMVYGPPGSGKTFIVVDAIFAACLGQRWAMRFDVARPLTVCYAAGEGLSGLKERFRAAAAHYNVTDYLPGFSFSALVPQLFAPGGDGIDQFIAEWRQRQDEGGPALDLLVIDTLHSATVGAEENSATDMGKVLAAAKLAATQLGCAVLLVHHTNKAGTGERGSSALRGAMDLMIEVAPAAGKFSMSCAKLKDGEAWKSQTFDLVAVDDCESVRVWWDEPGDGDGRKSNTAHEILTLLSEGDGRALTAKQISEATGHKPQQVNKVAGRLVKEGMVERTQNARGTWQFAVTPEGVSALQDNGRVI